MVLEIEVVDLERLRLWMICLMMTSSWLLQHCLFFRGGRAGRIVGDSIALSFGGHG